MNDALGQMAPEETPLYSFMPNGSAENMVTVFKGCIEMRVDGRVIRKPIRGWCEAVMSFSDETKRADDAVRALKGLSAWHDHRSLTGLPHGCPVPPAVPSFDTVVKAVHAAIGKPPYKAEEMPEEPK